MDEPDSPYKEPAGSDTIEISPILIIGLVGVFLLMVGVALYIIVNSKKSQTTTTTLHPSVTPVQPQVINPNSHTASRYYKIVGQSNYLDFREDGSMGDFKLSMTRVGNRVSLQWNPSVSVNTITVYDVGKLEDLTDQLKIFSISTLKKIDNPRFMVVEQDGVINTPYTVGNSLPQITPMITSAQSKDMFIPGHRYSIEAHGAQNGKNVWAAYTFTD